MDSTPSSNILSLCSTLRRLLAEEKYAAALACSWLVIVHDSHSTFRHASESYATSDQHQWSELVARLVAHDWTSADLGANPLLDLASMPSLLVQVCSELLASRFTGWFADKIAEEDELYDRGVMTVDIAPSLASQLGVEVRAHRLFVVRRQRSPGPSPVQLQYVDPERFNRRFHVIPDVPDRNQSERLVAVRPASAGLQRASRTILERASMALTVYVAEFWCIPEFDSHITSAPGGRSTWMARNIKNFAGMRDEVTRHLARARDAGADVVVFPELTFPSTLRKAASEWLRDENTNADNAHHISWVIAGSFHEAQDPGTRPFNEAFAMDARGNSIPEFQHRKLTQVDLDRPNIVEDIELGTRITLVASAIGLQSVVICLDLAQGAAYDKLPLHFLPIDWLWVPSLAERVGAHKTRAKDLCVQRPVSVVCSNQAQAKCTDELILSGDPLQSFAFYVCNGKAEEVKPLDGPKQRSWHVFDFTLSS